MEGFKSVSDQINNYEKPLTTHLYLLKVSQVMEKREILTEPGMKIQILKKYEFRNKRFGNKGFY